MPTPTPGPYPPAFPPPDAHTAGDWWYALGANLWSFVHTEAGALAALAALATAFIAIRALRATAADSRERSRPVVFAWFRVAEHNDRAFDFVVKNYGPSAAHNVTLMFDPPFSEEQRKDRLTEIVAQRWDKAMPVFPPGAEMKNLWWSSRPPESGQKDARNALATPDEVTVTIKYDGGKGQSFTEVMPLDGRWMKLDSSSISSDSNRGRLKQIAEALGKVAQESRSARYFLRDIAEGVNSDSDDAETFQDPTEVLGGVLDAPMGDNPGDAGPETAPKPKSTRSHATPAKPKPAEEASAK